jgi:hypothetical protein
MREIKNVHLLAPFRIAYEENLFLAEVKLNLRIFVGVVSAVPADTHDVI